ncbi:MAG: diguanylate cyclase [Pseudomonadota bacterium]
MQQTPDSIRQYLCKAFYVNPNLMVLSRSADGIILDVSDSFLRLFGYRKEEVIGQSSVALHIWSNETDRELLLLMLERYGSVRDLELNFQSRDGKPIRALISVERIPDPDGDLLLFVGQDITARIELESALARSESQYRQLIETLPDGAVVVQNGRFVYLNPMGVELSGYETSELVGHPFLPFIHEDDRQRLSELHERRMGGECPDSALEFRFMTKDKGVRHWRARTTTIEWNGQPAGLGVFTDITEQYQTQCEIEYMALHDPLTGLANRRLLLNRIEQAFAHARRKECPFALLYFDLDNFKLINDLYGHAFGDEVLQKIGFRLLSSIRESDIAARIGGDEFIVLLDETDTQSATIVADKIREHISQPIELPSGQHMHMYVSIGISVFPDHGSDSDALIRHADHHMYCVKKSHQRANGKRPGNASPPLQ